jgi:hypothetical protein
VSLYFLFISAGYNIRSKYTRDEASESSGQSYYRLLLCSESELANNEDH